MTDPDRAALKAELRAAIADARPDGTYDEAAFARVHAAIERLVPLTPTPRPVDAQDFVSSPWVTRFAQFGPRHTAGKPKQHDTTMNLLSFGKYPAAPISVLELEQEIRTEDAHYNNVQVVTTRDGSLRAHLIMWGRYVLEADTPQRYRVDFYAVDLISPDSVADDELRARFGLPADYPLHQELKPPKLHSDVVYCDDDMRINFGSMGGVYVLDRLATPGKSVAFPGD